MCPLYWGVAQSCVSQKPGDTLFTTAQGCRRLTALELAHHTIYGGMTSGLVPCLPGRVTMSAALVGLLWVLKDVVGVQSWCSAQQQVLGRASSEATMLLAVLPTVMCRLGRFSQKWALVWLPHLCSSPATLNTSQMWQ